MNQMRMVQIAILPLRFLKCLIWSAVLSCFAFSALGTQKGDWVPDRLPQTPKGAKQVVFPKAGQYFRLDLESLKEKLRQAPQETNGRVAEYGMPIELPMPDGRFQRFAIASYELLDKPLDDKFPEMRNFYGQGLDEGSSQVYLDFTLHGFHALILSPEDSILIDPVFLHNTEWYVSYSMENAGGDGPRDLTCGAFHDSKEENHPEKNLEKAGGPGSGHTIQVDRGASRKNYRMAIATTVEFTQASGGTLGTALGLVNTQLNRANAIFGRDLCLRFSLVTNSVFVMNTSTDSYINTLNNLLLTQNNAVLNVIIGPSNYDIGHLFTTMRGGLAEVSSVCALLSKGRAASGTPNPFDAQFLGIFCHEVGHQLGAEHTFNGTMGNCNNDNRNQASAVEPGSGITMMSYPGSCSNDNLDETRIEFFHTHSLSQMQTFIEMGEGRTCGTNTSLNNLAPSFNITMPQNLTIPIGTPYTLSAVGTDPEGDILSFSWEQDQAASTPGPPDDPGRVDGPITRSLPPMTTGKRSIHTELEYLLPDRRLRGNNLGTVSRNMNFILTVRDNRAGGGVTQDLGYSFAVTDQAGPFILTFPIEEDVWGNREPRLITWNRANTHLPPINCSHVRITLSTDGARTFPYVLSASTPNDGEEWIQFPPGLRRLGYNCVIKMEAIGNIFYTVKSGFNLGDYCYSWSSTFDGDFSIRRVRFHTLDNSSTHNSSGYQDFTASGLASPILTPGQTYPLTINLGSDTALATAAWLDYNNDGDFLDPGEFLFTRGPEFGQVVQNITILAGEMSQGYRRMRVRTGLNTLFTAENACTDAAIGETEDYLVNISGYCFGTSTCAQGSNSFAIQRLQYRSLDVASGCEPTGYTDHSHLPPVDVRAGEVYPLLVSTSSETEKSIGVWIDRNYDFDFDDPGEFVFQTPVQTENLFEIPFQVPGQPLEFGVRRVRVRLMGNGQIGAAQACGLIGLGETEDFEINITGYCFGNSVCSDEGFGQHNIQRVQIPQLDNPSGCTVGGFRAYHEQEFLGRIILGQSTNGTVQINGGNLAGQGLWIDVNNDGYFDPEEQFASRAPTTNGTWNFSLLIPNLPAYAGIRRMRIRTGFTTTFGGNDACRAVGFGETEDYMVELSPINITVQNQPALVCRNNPFSVGFTTSGVFGAGNQYVVELSDPLGSFTSPVVVGSGTTKPVQVTIPASASLGGSYRLRVRSTAPALVSGTTAPFSLLAPPVVNSATPSGLWIGQEVTITGSGLNGVIRVYFGDAWSEPNQIFPDGSGLRVTIPPGADSGPVVLSGICETTGPSLSIRNCPFALTNPQITQAIGPGCQNGIFQATVVGPISGNAKVQVFKATAPGSAELVGNVILEGTDLAEVPGLAPGPHFAVLRDNSACRDTLWFTLSGIPCALNIDLPTTTDATGEDGTISFFLRGTSCLGETIRLKRLGTSGWAPFREGPSTSFSGAWLYSNLPAGSYRIVALDASGMCGDSTDLFVQSTLSAVATPIISPGGGVFGSAPSISIHCPTSSASIYYTLNGNVPVPGTAFTFAYSGPFVLTGSATVKAMAIRSGLPNSLVATAIFTLTLPTTVALPEFSTGPGVQDQPFWLSLQCSTPGSTLYYTLNGNNPRVDVPNSFTQLYSGPILISQNTTVRAMATAGGLIQSGVATARYTISNPTVSASTPVISPGTGSFTGSVPVSLSASTTGSIIYYTTNGNVPRLDIPNTFTKLYTGPFSINQTTTVRAIALAPGYNPSGVAVAFLTRLGAIREAVDTESTVSEDANWAVFPNPTQGKISIQASGKGQPFRVEVYSLQGKRVGEKTESPSGELLELDLSGLAPGMYSLHLETMGVAKTLKISKF